MKLKNQEFVNFEIGFPGGTASRETYTYQCLPVRGGLMAIGGIQNGLNNKVSAFGYFDSRDINRDGFVSPSELTTYSLRHPELKPSKRSNLVSNNAPNRFASENASMPQYNKRGAFRQQTSSTSRYLDMYA